MSVLIEALSLVVPRITLDATWPGGADAFLEAMRGLPALNPATWLLPPTGRLSSRRA